MRDQIVVVSGDSKGVGTEDFSLISSGMEIFNLLVGELFEPDQI